MPHFGAWVGSFVRVVAAIATLGAAGMAMAQQMPPAGTACVVTAGNRNAPLAADGTYIVFGIPGNAGAIRARASCTDGSVGQSAVRFTDPNQEAVLQLGPIVFGQLDPVPVAVSLGAPSARLDSGESTQLTLTAVAADGSTRDVTPRSEGTTYSVSNPLLASVGENGLLTIHPEFAAGASARVVAGAVSEGAAAATMLFTLGPRGTLQGQVLQADGVQPAPGAEVSILRLQPLEAVATVTAQADGRFVVADVNAGRFLVSAIDPATGDRASGTARIDGEGETATLALRFNGVGRVRVRVEDAQSQPVAGVSVTYTALGAFRTTQLLDTDAAGLAVFERAPVGDYTVSARDPATRLVGAAFARLEPGADPLLTLRLQPVGAIAGRVLGSDGAPVGAVQVRVVSRERGILSQLVTVDDGAFAFDTLPLGDGPYTLDAFVDGRLRARVPGVVLAQANATVARDVVFGPIGVVRGTVRGGAGNVYPDARVTLQSLEGLRLKLRANADANGVFRLDGVPIGDFELDAQTADGRLGRAAGRVASDGQVVERDVIVVEDTLVGTVFQRDGTTPVGAGVDVYLAPRSIGLRDSLAGHPQAVATQTDAQGRYGFSVPRADQFVVQAEAGAERARTQVVVVNLNPSQPLVADLAFLPKGSVGGRVLATDGSAQADVPVVVRSEGEFASTRETRTDAVGRYALADVFAGDLTVTATNTATALSGVGRGRLDAEGQHVEIDVTLAATGIVEGEVRSRDGSIVPDAVRVSLRRNGAVLQTLDLVDGTNYRFTLVPLGTLELVAERLATSDRGIASTRVSSAGEIRNVPIRLVGQADVEVQLRDGAGAPVGGARVVATQRVPFPLSRTLESDSEGRVRFEALFAGDFAIDAVKDVPVGQMSGSVLGTLLPDVDQSLVLTLDARAFGRIEGVVLRPDGVTPAAGVRVRMTPAPLPDAFVATTDAEGRYAFEPVDAGTYTVDAMLFYDPSSNACPNRDRVRGRASGVTLATQGQVVQANVQLIGQGSISGRITGAGGVPVMGATVRVVNPDPVYGPNVACGGGGSYDAITDADGRYALPDVPPGDFTATAADASRTRRAEGVGRVRFDGDPAVLDLVLVDSAVTMPRSFHDANGFRFDVNGNGSLGAGTNNVFAPPAPDTGGLRLEIVRDGIAVPFLNGDGTIGRLDEGGMQVEVDDETPSGLLVTRRVLTPRAGYFARYLEVLENPGSTSITVDVRVRSHHRQGDASPRVVDTSDGDQVLSVASATAPDRWAVIDDQRDDDPFPSGSIPATGHLFDGEGAATRVASAGYELIGSTGRLTYRWNAITVPAGGRAILMHFVLHQIDREAAREAAARLLQLPPEAIDDLTSDERTDIVNFAVPATSAMPPLPVLDAGIVEGRVLSADGETPVANAQVRFRSRHPLFGRERFLQSAANGAFRFRSTLDGSANNYVIPIHAFELSASYALSGAASAVAQGDFADDARVATQDLIFVGTGNLTGLVRRHNGSPVADADVRLCRQPDRGTCSPTPPNPSNHASSDATGRYLMLASPPRDYHLFASKAHPQGNRALLGTAQATITGGDTSVAHIELEPTGSVSGTVRAADGTPVVGASVELLDGANGPRQRMTTTDTAGFYRLSDVPLDTFHLRARDATSGAEGHADVTIAVDIESTRDIVLAGFGELDVQVRFARGTPAGGSRVSVDGHPSRTADSNGRAQFQVQVGEYEVTATHPESPDPALRARASAVVDSLGQQVDVALSLLPAGTVKGTIVRPDGTTLAGGFPLEVRQIRGDGASRRDANTQSTGAYRIGGLPVGGYVITAYDAEQDRFADAEFDIASDGEEVTVDLVLLDNRIALPATLRDANRFAYDVQRNASLALGTGAYVGGARLLVGGVAFTGESSARLEASRRQFAIAQAQPLAGLLVTRRVYVPRGAYYARYVETLANPGDTPLVVTVAVATTFAEGAARATSSGDTTLTLADRWIVLDDDLDEDVLLSWQQMPATYAVFAGPGGTPPSRVQLQSTAGRPELLVEWQDLVVPAHAEVSLLHFAGQQVRRSGAIASAERLVQLPPEAIAEPPSALGAATRNFAWPADGTSPVEALPSLTASLSGVAYEGDVRTPVRRAHVTVQSTHPIFSRVWGKHADPYFCPPGTPVDSLVSLAQSPGGVTDPPPPGAFSLQGQLTADDSIALPDGVPVRLVAQEPQPCFGYHAGHPFTRVPSPVETPTPNAVQDLVFDTGVLTGTIVGPADFSVTHGRVYRSIDDPDGLYPVYVPIADDATWVYPGLPSGRYDLLFDTSHPQGVESGGLLRGQRTTVDVTAGEIRVVDVDMQPTGAAQGTVSTALGAPSRDARVTLLGAAAAQDYDQCADGCVATTLPQHRGRRAVEREVRTDTLGRYSLAAVPAGTYTLRIEDPVQGALTQQELVVTADATVVQNVVLREVGAVRVEVRRAGGQPAADALVYLRSEHVPDERVAGRTDGSGRLTIASVPVGDWSLRVRDPRWLSLSLLERTAAGRIDAAGEFDDVQLTLRAAATLQVDVVDGDTGGAPVSGATVWLRDAQGERQIGTTGAQGRVVSAPLIEGAYTVRARATLAGVEKEETVAGSIGVADDDTTRNVAVDLRSALAPLPQTLYDANRDDYRINADGGSHDLPKLSVDGVVFSGATSAARRLGAREYAIAQAAPLSGLQVMRRAFVPRNGYFVRYLEVLDNPGASAVTVDVAVTAQLISSWEVRATGSGDALLDSGGATPDRWFTVGSSSVTNEHWALVSSGPGAVLPQPQLAHAPRVGSSARAASARWDDVTVPAGGRVILMHLLAKQIERGAAQASAERLAQLPPEAIEGLSTDDAAAVANFDLPEGGTSALPPLPALDGRVGGRVFEGDGATPVPLAFMTLRSTHPLFPRSWSGWNLRTGNDGAYVLQGEVRDDHVSTAIPVGSDVTITAEHPQSNLRQTVVGRFAADSSQLQQDVVFDAARIVGSVSGAFQSPLRSGRVTARRGTTYAGQSPLDGQGRYALGGLLPGDYALEAEYDVPSGTALRGRATASALVIGEQRTRDIVLDPNGALAGRVLDAAGQPRGGVQLELRRQDFARWVTSDAQGGYAWGAIPAATYLLRATDPTTLGRVETDVVIGADATLTHDVVLPGIGNVTATVRYARGVPVPGVTIRLDSPTVSGTVYHGPTDENGQRTFPVAVGEYALQAMHPQSGYYGEASGVVGADGESSSIDLLLPASADLSLRVVDGDAGSTPLAGVRVHFQSDATSGQTNPTDGDGTALLTSMTAGTYRLSASAPDGRSVVEFVTIDAAVDGQTVERTLAVRAGDDTLGELTFSDARHLYLLPADAGDQYAISIRPVEDCPVRVEVLTSGGATLAYGYGRGPSAGHAQVNEYGDLRAIAVEEPGPLVLVVYPREYWCFDTGYRLSTTRNGQSQVPQPFEPSATLEGRVLLPDGTPVPSARLRLRVTSGLGIGLETLSDAFGAFRFAHLPLGAYELEYVTPSDSSRTGRIAGYLTVAGDVVERDLTLDAITDVVATVRNADGSLVGANVRVEFRALDDSRSDVGYTLDDGRAEYEYVGNGTLAVRARDPQRDGFFAEVQVEPLDGGTREVELRFLSASVAGDVRDADGTPAAGASVVLEVARNREAIESATTDAAGRYAFALIPANVALQVRANDPRNDVPVTVALQASEGEAAVRDLVLRGRGSIEGRVLTQEGAPLGNAYLEFTYRPRADSPFSDARYASTDGEGRYRFDDLPVGLPIRTRVSLYLAGQDYEQEGELQLATHGQALVHDFEFDVPGGSLVVVVEGSDGLAAPGQCQLYLERESVIEPSKGEGGGGWLELSEPCDSPLRFASVPPGDYVLDGNAGDLTLESREIEIVDGETRIETYSFPTVRGNVRYHDGAPADDAYVEVTDALGDGFYGDSDEDGLYRVLGPANGEFAVRADDNRSGLSVEATGQLLDAQTPAVVDLQFGPTGLIDGLVHDHTGAPVADASIYALDPVSGFERWTSSDAAGAFGFDRVPVGTQGLTAIHPQNTTTAVADVEIAAADAVVPVTLQLAPPGRIGGLLDDGAGTPVAGACIEVASTEPGPAHSAFAASTTTDAAGRYAFDAVIAGRVRVQATDCALGTREPALAEGVVVAGQETTIDLHFGTARAAATAVLSDASSGFDFSLTFPSSLQAASTVTGLAAIAPGFQWQVDGWGYPHRPLVLPGLAGRELALTAQGVPGPLRLRRRLYVPSAGGYARWFDEVTNEGTVPREVTLGYYGSYPAWGNVLHVAPDSTGRRYAVQAPANPAAPGASPVAGLVFAGVGAVAPTNMDLLPGVPWYHWSWTLTLAPGETRSILQYAVPRAPGDAAAAQAQADRLSLGQESGMFEGLSAEEKASVYNFMVPL